MEVQRSQPSITAAPLSAHRAATPSPETSTAAPLRSGTDSLRIAGGGGATPDKVRTFETQAPFETGQSQIGKAGSAGLNKTLDAVVATFKVLSPEQQQALLADPNFKIEVEGHASNLGTSKKFDNLGLSRHRAAQTADYVKSYLRERGLVVPDAAIKTTGTGAPGTKKATDDNDPNDRMASIRFTLPGLDPLPAAPTKPETTKPPVVTQDPAVVPPVATPDVPAPVPATPAGPSPAELALKDFNQAILPVGDLLTKGKAQETTLADREALVSQAQQAVQQAEQIVPQLDPSAQLGAQALISSYKQEIGGLADQAGQQRADLTKAQGAITADAEQLTKASAGKDKGELRSLIDKLRATYQNPETLGKGLPEDARKTLKEQAAGLLTQVRDAIAHNCDSSDIDRTDNSYLFGRPGPKFKKNWEALEGMLQANPPSAEQRQNAVSQLKEMGDAVKDFDDPLTKEATQSVYAEISKAVFAKLSGA